MNNADHVLKIYQYLRDHNLEYGRQSIVRACQNPDIIKLFGKAILSEHQVKHFLQRLRRENKIPPRGRDRHYPNEEKDDTASIFPEHLEAEEIGYPQESPEDYVKRLEEEVASLRRQQEWLTHSSARSHRGGTLTINCSDFHLFDRGFLLNSADNLLDKCINLILLFKPRRVFIVVNGDVVPGRGIYRNQHQENVLPRTDQQIAAGVYYLWEWHQKIVEQTKLRAEWYFTLGTHDYSMGEPIVQYIVWGLSKFSISCHYVGTEWIHNAADVGTYNILFEHGYGGSTFSPASNKLVVETLIKIIKYQNMGYSNEKRIRRFASGHSHWLNLSMERVPGIFFDTTGGLHRNDRANIGLNDRPCGFIVYISPKGSDSILEPVRVIPDENIYWRDINNPDLEEENRAEAARCLKEFAVKARDLGIIKDFRSERQQMWENLISETPNP